MRSISFHGIDENSLAIFESSYDSIFPSLVTPVLTMRRTTDLPFTTCTISSCPDRYTAEAGTYMVPRVIVYEEAPETAGSNVARRFHKGDLHFLCARGHPLRLLFPKRVP